MAGAGRRVGMLVMALTMAAVCLGCSRDSPSTDDAGRSGSSSLFRNLGKR